MQYSSPQLSSLGSLSYLTLGQNGSNPDGGIYDNQNAKGTPSDNNQGGGQGNPNGTGSSTGAGGPKTKG
ncbi:MAG TPA: hypothetical protein VN520_02665 [Streptomyces sp.]|uniref:hypothetical protein n=1 Tax=Streptomyces sp. TaxID=1931 RepID=UPI002C173AD9|nr:hypothetical protein [Streptomyces sp.]HWU05300.1 hypothetical protein [Streptomyces sp.]